MFSISVFRWRPSGTLRFSGFLLDGPWGQEQNAMGEMVPNKDKQHFKTPLPSAIRGQCHEESRQLPLRLSSLRRSQEASKVRFAIMFTKLKNKMPSFFSFRTWAFATQTLIQAKALVSKPHCSLPPPQDSGEDFPTPPPGKEQKLEDIAFSNLNVFNICFSGGAHLAH